MTKPYADAHIQKAALSWSIDIDVPREQAWAAMTEPPLWNPGFVHATVDVVGGEKLTVGEIAHIRFGDGTGAITDELHTEIVRLDPHHITWYVVPAADGPEDYRNFIEFELEERPGGVTFRLHYFLQNPISAAAFAEYRAAQQELLTVLGTSLKEYLER